MDRKVCITCFSSNSECSIFPWRKGKHPSLSKKMASGTHSPLLFQFPLPFLSSCYCFFFSVYPLPCFSAAGLHPHHLNKNILKTFSFPFDSIYCFWICLRQGVQNRKNIFLSCFFMDLAIYCKTIRKIS